MEKRYVKLAPERSSVEDLTAATVVLVQHGMVSTQNGASVAVILEGLARQLKDVAMGTNEKLTDEKWELLLKEGRAAAGDMLSSTTEEQWEEVRKEERLPEPESKPVSKEDGEMIFGALAPSLAVLLFLGVQGGAMNAMVSGAALYMIRALKQEADDHGIPSDEWQKTAVLNSDLVEELFKKKEGELHAKAEVVSMVKGGEC
ncbi:MAG: hypothetical protein O7B23_10815 [Deltaproteobacteria bacterium]|nr:hypothetical protein [Deltaproteobacteria bacterium]